MPENAKKPQIRFKGFTDAWEQRKFYEIFEERHIISTISEEYPQLSFTISDGVIFPEDRKTNKRDFLIIDKATKKYLVTEYNDIIYNPANVIYGAIHRNSLRKGCVSPIYKIFFTKQNSKFMECIVRNENFINSISKSLEGTVTKLKTLKPESFLKMSSYISPIFNEQEKIGEFFSNIDNLITLHQRKLDKLKNIKKSMLEKMFPKNGCNVPEIRFKGFTDAWEQRKLGNLGKTYTGLSGKTKDDFGHGKAQFITYMNVYSNTIIDVEMTEPIEIDLKQNEVEIGDVFFTTSSETPEEVGMSSVLLKKCGTVYLNSFCFGFRPFIILDNYFLAYMLRAQVTRKQIILLAQGISRYNISKNKVMEINIFVPHDKEQQQLGKFFYKLDNLITLHQRKLEKLQNIKKACLEKMFV